MASSSSSDSQPADVFPSFSGKDVRYTFLSHLLKELKRKKIRTFSDNGIERSCPIGPALLSAIQNAKISIVIFSKNYASSKWCLDELVEIHNCYKKEVSPQKVIPIFYNVDPGEVRKQTGNFEVFEETCKDKPDDQIQKWKQALSDVADLAGEHILEKVDEARIVKKIVNDVANKLITPPLHFSGGLYGGIEAHIEAMNSKLCLRSEEVKMVGIVGLSGIGKSTIGRELFTQISKQFPYNVFATYKRTSQDDCDMKLNWANQFLSGILDEDNIKIRSLDQVEQKLIDKKVLIVLDDVVELALLETLVRKTEWFGRGSRIIVITQDKHILKAHKIDDIYEVELPSEDLALEMFCQSAFEQKFPPDGFIKLSIEVVKLAGNLPLGLRVLGSSLKGRNEEDWIKMLPRLQNILDGGIGKTLRVGYDRLDKENQRLFLYVACLFSSLKWNNTYIQHALRDSSVNIGLKILAEKSLVRITTPEETVEMHDLLKKLGREIVREESIDPGNRRFLMDVDDIREVLTYNTGTGNVLGIYLETLDVKEAISIHEKSFECMHNLQILIILSFAREGRLDLPQGLDCLPRQLKVLWWNFYPAECLPSTFKAEYLVKLIMISSELRKLWKGTQPLRHLRVMDVSDSK